MVSYECQFLNFINNLLSKIPKYIDNVSFVNNAIILDISFNNVIFILFFLKNHYYTQFNILVDLTAIDYLSKKPRFNIVYIIRSVNYNISIIVRVFSDGFVAIPSVTKIYSGSNWLEREVWDMYGIAFSDHVDLRRILSDYGFQGFPLRKDFPLSGFIEVRYDDETKRISYDMVELSQEFRLFDFQSPWQRAEFEKVSG